MDLYHQVLKLITPYFASPVMAAAFLTRQCRVHLNRSALTLCPHDLWALANGVTIAGTWLVGQSQAEEMGDKIRALRRAMREIPARGYESRGARGAEIQKSDRR